MIATQTAFRAMGCDIVVAGADEPGLEAIRELFAARDQMFSRFRPDSELCSVNRAAGRPTYVSRRFATAVSCALAMAEETGGLVDLTVGESLTALGYGRDFAELGDDPAPAAPVAAAPGWRRDRAHRAAAANPGRLCARPERGGQGGHGGRGG